VDRRKFPAWPHLEGSDRHRELHGPNLTEQVRGIVKVVTAVANGDLKQNLTVKSKGEVAALAETINHMTDTLATFADQVSSVAREVGVEAASGSSQRARRGRNVEGFDRNFNLLAATYLAMCARCRKVATAVTKGDLTGPIQVDARGR